MSSNNLRIIKLHILGEGLIIWLMDVINIINTHSDCIRLMSVTSSKCCSPDMQNIICLSQTKMTKYKKNAIIKKTPQSVSKNLFDFTCYSHSYSRVHAVNFRKYCNSYSNKKMP